MNKNVIFILFIPFFYSCEFQKPESPETPSWHLPISVPLTDTEYSFEGILQDGVINTTAEDFEDCGSDADCSFVDPDGSQSNGSYDLGELFTDENGNGIWDNYGLSDSLSNMMQIEFINDIDSVGLNVVEQELGMSFFKLDLSDISIEPQIIQDEITYDLSDNLPSPLIDPTVVPVSIEIPESDNNLINNILQSCDSFIPDNEQSLSIPVDLSSVPDPISTVSDEFDEPIVVEVPLDIDFDAIDLGEIGDISIEKIILNDSMEWEVEFRNGLPFIVDLSFNIYKGPISNQELFTSLLVENIDPYTTVVDNINFESYELTLDSSLFAELDFVVHEDQLPSENCPLNICIADAISVDETSGEVIVNEDNFSIYESTEICTSNCNPCFGEDVFVCVADAIDASGNIVGDPTIYQGDGSELDCTVGCESCVDFSLAVCVADAVDASGNIVGDPTLYQGNGSQGNCEAACAPCLDLTTSVCVADAVDASGNIVGDPTTYQGPGSQLSCESSCAPCLQQLTYVCPLDSVVYDIQSDCINSCAIDCVVVDSYSCLTDALDDSGNVDVSLIQVYSTSNECLLSCDPCYVEPIHACTTDALDNDGNVDTDLIQTYSTSGECNASCDPCYIEPIHACTTDALDDDGNVLDEDLNGDGIPDSITIYSSSGECSASCDPCYNASIYVCTTDNTIIDGDDSTAPIQYSSNAECVNSGCESCIQESLSGWDIQDDEITFNLNGELLIDTLVVNLDISNAPPNEPIEVAFPAFDQVQVREALIDDGSQFDDYGENGIEGDEDFGENDGIIQEGETEYSNEFTLNVDNGFFGGADLELIFSNIYENGELYSQNISIPAQTSVSESFDLSNKVIGKKELNINLENIQVDYDFSIASGQYKIPLLNNVLTIQETGYSAEVSSIKLKSISAITEEIDFPQVQSVPLQGLPVGFDDFKLYDIFLEMNIYNQITINTVQATFDLTGKKCPSGVSTDNCFADESIESKNFPFDVALDSPNRNLENPCDYQVGDIAVTKISINKDSQITRYFCSENSEEPYEVIESPFDGEENVNLLDFIYFGPNQMNLQGSVLIDGEGTLREDDNLWGDFSIVAPLAFVFDEDWVFIPQDYTTIDALDVSLSEQIEDALVEAEFNAEITNNSPLGISMSMLASDSTIFPLYLDDLYSLDERCSNNLYLDENSCNSSGFSWVNYQDSLSRLGVDNISFESIDANDNRAYYVEFFANDINGQDSILFWVGRVIDVSFVPPLELDANGFVVNPSVSFSSEVLDAKRVSWFTASENRFMVPMITLAGTGGEPASLQTDNFLGVKSFLTFILDTEGLSRKNDKLTGNQKSNNHSIR